MSTDPRWSPVDAATADLLHLVADVDAPVAGARGLGPLGSRGVVVIRRLALAAINTAAAAAERWLDTHLDRHVCEWSRLTGDDE